MKNCTANNLSQKLPIPNSQAEVAELTDTFNQMSGKLDQAFAMQRRFAQSAAHELRTPLTVLRAKLDVFKKRTDHSQAENEKRLSNMKKLSLFFAALLVLVSLAGCGTTSAPPPNEDICPG